MTKIKHEQISRLREQLMGVTRRLRQESKDDQRSWARLLLLGAADRYSGKATPSELAADLRWRSSNMATALRELEADDLIVRTPDLVDRRKVRVAVTAQGYQMLNASRMQRELWLAEAMEHILTGKESVLLLEAGELLDRICIYSRVDLKN
ncbi:MarR family winged helix-turn-helix transcriptional regulator [Pseudomonas sp. MDT1-85]